VGPLGNSQDGCHAIKARKDVYIADNTFKPLGGLLMTISYLLKNVEARSMTHTVRENNVNLTDNPARLFTESGRTYIRFVRAFGYPQGLRSFFMTSTLLRSGLRVLDAGCGSGIITLALRQALLTRGCSLGPLHCFDLTPAMLDQFHYSLQAQAIDGVELVQADVLRLNSLPDSWCNYDLIVSASMLEYVPRDKFVTALNSLRSLLNKDGSLLLFITRENLIMRLLIGRWWQSNVYTLEELRESFALAGFSMVAFRKFPFLFNYLNTWGYIVEARG